MEGLVTGADKVAAKQGEAGQGRLVLVPAVFEHLYERKKQVWAEAAKQAPEEDEPDLPECAQQLTMMGFSAGDIARVFKEQDTQDDTGSEGHMDRVLMALLG